MRPFSPIKSVLYLSHIFARRKAPSNRAHYLSLAAIVLLPLLSHRGKLAGSDLDEILRISVKDRKCCVSTTSCSVAVDFATRNLTP